MTATISRMAPGEAQEAGAVQGWAMSGYAPEAGPERPVDLLFVHGMAAGGWMWSPEWIAEFTGHGYRVWTITLPGREGGRTLATDPAALDHALKLALAGADARATLDAAWKALPGAALFDGPGLEDFADAIAEGIARIGRPTAVIAHSLGGAAAQMLIRRGRAPAATVLMSSVPPYGLWRASLEMALTNPALFGALQDFSLGGIAALNHAVMKANLFPGGDTAHAYARMVPQLTDESLKAMMGSLGWPPFAPLPHPRRDVMVIGGTEDRFVPALDATATAFYYGTVPRIVPGAGHMMMHEAVAPGVAGDIRDFLESRP